MNQASDYYTVLGVHPQAEDEVITAAYKALAKKYHPDTGNSAASAAKFMEVQEAYQVLSDPVRRKAYDDELTRARAGANESNSDPRVTSDPSAGMDQSRVGEEVSVPPTQPAKSRKLNPVQTMLFATAVVAFAALVWEMTKTLMPENDTASAVTENLEYPVSNIGDKKNLADLGVSAGDEKPLADKASPKKQITDRLSGEIEKQSADRLSGEIEKQITERLTGETILLQQPAYDPGL